MTESPRSFDVEGTDDGAPLPAPPEPLDPTAELEEEGDEEEEEEELAGAAAAPARPANDPAEMSEADLLRHQAAQPKRKRKKMSGGGGAAMPPAHRMVTPPRGEPKPPPERVVKVLAAPDEDQDDPDAWPTDALALWETLLRWLGRQVPPIPADRVSITVSRKLLGPVSLPPVTFQAIKGAAVTAHPPYSASEQLQRYLVTTYHSIGGAGRREGCGHAEYTLGFYWVHTGKTIKVGHVQFDSYAVMCAIQERANAFEEQLEGERQQAEAVGPAPAGASPYPARRLVAPAGYPAPGYGPPAYAPAAHAAGDPDLHRRLGYLEAVKEEFDRASAEGRAPREIAPQSVGAVAPAPMTTAAEDDARMARVATAAVQAALAAAGIRPQTEEERMAKMMAAQSEIITKNVLAVLGPLPSPGAVGAGAAAPVGTPNVQQTVANIKELLDQFKTIEEAKTSFRDLIGVAEEPDDRAITPERTIVEQKPQGFMEKAMGLLKALPPGALPATLAVLGKAFAGSPAGDMLALAAMELKNPSIPQGGGGGGGWGSKPR